MCRLTFLTTAALSVWLFYLPLPWRRLQQSTPERKRWAGETSGAFPAAPSSQALAETWRITILRKKKTNIKVNLGWRAVLLKQKWSLLYTGLCTTNQPPVHFSVWSRQISFSHQYWQNIIQVHLDDGWDKMLRFHYHNISGVVFI